MWLSTVLVLSLSNGCAHRQAPSDGSHSIALQLSEIDAYLHSRAQAGFSGTVLIASKGKVVLEGAYAPAHSNVTAQTEFWLGSVSKNVTAAAVLKLQEQGRLHVADSIHKHLASVPQDKLAITIHQLLSHTSGLGENYAADGIADARKATQAILRPPLSHPPGEKFLYTNDGYNLLAIIIEHASGLPYEEYVQSQLLQRAGMAHTGFWGDPPTPHQHVVAPFVQPDDPSIAAANWGYRGATGLRSTVGDLHRWSDALDSATVLSQTSVDALFQAHARVTTTRAYGYGWQLVKTSRGTNAQVHNGADDQIGGFAALYRFVDEDVVVVMLSNSSESLAVETLRGLFARIFKE